MLQIKLFNKEKIQIQCNEIALLSEFLISKNKAHGVEICVGV